MTFFGPVKTLPCRQVKYEKYQKRPTYEKINTICNTMDLLDGQSVMDLGFWKPTWWDDLVLRIGCSEIMGKVGEKIT